MANRDCWPDKVRSIWMLERRLLSIWMLERRLLSIWMLESRLLSIGMLERRLLSIRMWGMKAWRIWILRTHELSLLILKARY